MPLPLARTPSSAVPGGAAIVSTLVDTNVLSELLRAQRRPALLAWLARQPADNLFVSAVTQAEMLFGARLLPRTKLRQQLEAALDAMFR